MTDYSNALKAIPQLEDMPAAFGALSSEIQVGGNGIFEIVVATVTGGR